MRTRLRNRSHLIMASTLLAAAIIFGLLFTVRLVAFASPDPVRAALEHARQAGTYHFNANVDQFTDPVPSVRNAGRTSRHHAMHMQGDNDLHARTMDMQLWNQGGNIRTGEGQLEVRIENDTTYIRKPGQAWQEQDSVTDIAAPNGDFLTYLDATHNVQEAGTYQHTLPDGKTIAYTRYTFDIHGPTLAEHMRQIIQQQLTEQGELPPGLKMAKPKLYEDMQGSGELWVTHDGLPLRQILNLEFPEQDDEQVRSSISVTFSGFARPPPTATWRWWVNSGAVGSILQQWSANHGKDVLYAMFAMMLIGMLGFLLVTQYHSRRLRSTLSMLLCLVIITGPLLQNLRVADFGTTRKALAAEQEQQQDEYDEHQERINSYIETDHNPHANPVEQAKVRTLDNGETLRATSLQAIAPRGETLRATSLQTIDPHGETLRATSLQAINADEWDHLLDEDGDGDTDDDFDSTDSDGDGLTDAQEELLGTTASGDYADDTDDDDISDYDEVIGFTYNGMTWYTDPNDMDTNNDTLMDGQEWDANEDGNIDDTDGDGIPDLFDQDNDGDGVMDYDDDAPWTSTMADAGESLNLSISGLQTDTPTIVDFQIRPDNPDHLWYANNILDWPDGDKEGNIHDYDGHTFADEGYFTNNDLADYGDMTLIPMLQIRTPDGSSQLPYGDSVSVDLDDLDDATDTGSVVVTLNGTTFTIAPDDDTSGNGWSYTLVEGECDDLDSATDVGSVGTSGTINHNLQDLLQADEDGDGYAEERISHAIVAKSSNSTVACGDMGTIVFEDGNLIDRDKLEIYGVSVSDDYSDTTDESWKLIYVPLSVVNDSYTDAQVAFSGSMYYMPHTASEWEDHQIELVWMLQMLIDSCDEYEEDGTKCVTYGSSNEETFIYTYNDDWFLTALTVREDHGAEMGIIFEDLSVNTDLEYGTTVFGLANDLATLFMIDETMTADTLTRYDHTYTGSDSEAADYSNNLRVKTLTGYETQYELLLDAVSDGGGSDAILDEYYTSYAQSDPDLAPLLLFARRELGRTITLDALESYMQWTASDSSLAVDMDSFDGSGASQVSDDRSISLSPYQYDNGWQSYDMEDYLESLDERYDPDTSSLYDTIDWSEIIGGDTQDNRQGLLDILELFIIALNNGISDTAMVGDIDLYDEDEVYSSYKSSSIIIGQVESMLSYITEKLLKEFVIGKSVGKEASTKSLYSFLKENSTRRNLAIGVTVVVLVAVYVILEVFLDLGWYEIFTGSSGSSLSSRIVTGSIDLVQTISTEVKAVYKAWKSATTLAKSMQGVSKMQSFMQAMKLNAIKSAKASVVTSIVIGLIMIGYFIYMWASGTIERGSIGFKAALAYLVASLLILMATIIIASTLIGAIILFIIAIIDTMLFIFGEETITERVTQALAKAFYDVTQLSKLEDPEFSNISQVIDSEVGFAHGGSVDYSMDIESTFTRATNAYSYYSGDPDILKKTSMEYELSNDTSIDSVALGANKNDWNVTQSGNAISGTKSDYVEQTIPLVSGVNYRPTSNLNFAYAIPLLERELHVINWIVWVEYNVISAKGTDTSEMDSLVYDVVPATIDDFFTLSSANGGGYRLAWDSQFPALADADGDGLLSTALQGSDPDDSTWDTDNDGLPDLYELEQQEEGNYFDPKDSDSDDDGLPDWEENFVGSNPADGDTDNDGLYDCEEVYYMLTTAEDRTACDSFVESQTSGTDTARTQGGWQVTIGGQGSLTTYAMSDPTVADTDEDGLNDFAEYELRSKGYHPQVENPNPVAVTSALLDANGNKLDDGNGYAKPGDSIILRNIVSTSQTGSDSSTEWSNTLQIELPTELGGNTRTTALDLVNDEERYIYDTLDVPDSLGEGEYAVTSEMIARTISNASGDWSMSVSDSQTLTNLKDKYGLGIGVASMPSRGADAYLYTMRTSDTGEAYIIAPDGAEYSLDMGFGCANDPPPDVACNDEECLVVYADSNGESLIWTHFEPDNIANFSSENMGLWPDFTYKPIITSDGTYFVHAYEAGYQAASYLMASTFNPWTKNVGTKTLETSISSNRRSLHDLAWVGFDTYVLMHEDTDGNLRRDQLTVSSSGITRRTTGALVSSSNNPGTSALAYAPDHNRVAVIYEENGTIKRQFGDVSSSSISFGGRVAIGSGVEPSITYDPYSESWLVAWTYVQQKLDSCSGPPDRHFCTYVDVPYVTNIAYDIDGNERDVYTHQEDLDDYTGSVACPDSSTVPLVHLALDETAGSTTFPSEYNDIEATCSGDGCPAVGVVGERTDGTTEIWTSFDGVNDELSIPSGEIDLANKSFTVAFWAKRASTDAADYVFWQGQEASNQGLHIGFRDADTFTCSFWDNDLNYDYTEDNEWHHWACTYNVNNGTRVLYRDGAAVASHTGRAPYTGSGELIIGQRRNSVYYHGELDDVRIYQNNALNADSIKAMYNDAEQSACTNVYYANDNILYSNIAFTQNESSIAQINNDDTVEVMVDTTAPSSSFTSINDGDVISIPNNGVKTISGAASDTGDIASGIGSVQVRVDSGTWEDATGKESWAYNLSGLSDGNHTIDVQATDAVGNESDISSITITIDDTAPTITLDVADSTMRLQRSSTDADKWIVSLVGTASDAHSVVETVEATLRGSSRTYIAQDVVLSKADATWSMNYVLNDVDPTDTYAVEITAEDILGNSTTQTFESIAVDMTAPTVGIASDASDVESITDSMTFSGTISDTGNVASGVQSLEWSLISNDDAYHLENIAYERILDLPFDANGPYTDLSSNPVVVPPVVDMAEHQYRNYCADDASCPTFTQDGAFGDALTFDGSDDELTFTFDESVNLANGFTLSAWIYPNSDGMSGWHDFLGYHPSSGYANRPPGLWLYNGTSIHSGFGDGTNWNTVNTNDEILSDTWSHIVATYDGTTYRIYVNGTEVALTQSGTTGYTGFAGRSPVGFDTIYVGKIDNRFAGGVDEVLIYDRALDANEVADLTINTLPDDTPVLNQDFEDDATHAWCEGNACPQVTSDGAHNEALTFDGVDDVLTISMNKGVSLDNGFTLATWIYPPSGSTSGWHDFLGYHPSSGHRNRPPGFWLYNGTNIHSGFGDGTNWNTVSTNDEITLDTWNHVATTYDGTTYRIYVNGTEVALTQSGTTGYTGFAGRVPIGFDTINIGKVDNRFAGSLDEVFIYDRALDANDIAKLATYQQPSDIPVLDMSFDVAEPYVFPVQDVSGQSNHAYCDDGTCPTHTSDGRIDGALEFDGVDDMLTIPEDAIDIANQSFSVSFWARRDSSGSNHYVLAQGTNTTNQGLAIGFRSNDTFTCAFWGNDFNTSATYTDTDWHHWTCTYDADAKERAIYRDGALVDSVQTNVNPYQGSGTLSIGYLVQVGWGFFEGALDKLQIYQRALTSDEVDTLYRDADRVWYNATLGAAGATDTTWSITLPDDTGQTHMEGYYQLDMRGTDMLNNRNDDLLTWTMWNGEIDTQAPEANITISDNGDGTYAHTCTATDLNIDDTTMTCSDETVTYNETLTYYESDWWDELQDETGIQKLIGIERQLDTTLPYGTVEVCDTYGNCSSDETHISLILDMSFESAPDNLTVADESLYGNDATCDSEDTCPSLSDYAYGAGKAFVFDGVDDVLTIPDIDLANKSFSVAFWAKRDGSGNEEYIISQGAGGARLYIGFRDQDWFTFAFWTNIDDTDTTAFTDNAWHHWVSTYDVTTQTRSIYRDGVLRKSGTISNYQSTGELLIGKRSDGFYFDGMLDELRIYNYALSADEVTALASATSLLLYLPFEQEPENDTIIDHSFHSNNAACDLAYTGICPIPDMPGMVGNASSFNFTAGNRIVASWDTSVSLADGFTLATWVYPDEFSDGLVSWVIGYQTSSSFSDIYAAPTLWLYGLKIKVGFGDGTDFNTMMDSTKLPMEAWSHVATTFDGTTYRIYLNGEEVKSSTSFAGRTPLDLSTISIGNLHSPFGGFLDELYIYNRALDAFEIADLADPTTNATSRAARSLHYNQTRMRSVMQRSAHLTANEDMTVAILDPPDNAVYNTTDPISITVLAAASAGIEDLTLTVNGEDAGVSFVPQSTTPITTTPGPEPEPQDQQQIYLPLVMRTNIAASLQAPPVPPARRGETSDSSPVYGGARGGQTKPVTITLPITNTAPITYSIFYTEWTPPGDGWYDLEATVHAEDGATATSNSVRIGVDTTEPEVLISTTVLTGYDDLTGAVPLMLRGTATDNTQVKYVQVRMGDSKWTSAIRDNDNDTWSLSAQPFLDIAREPDALTDDLAIVAPDNETMPVTAQVTDIGGHTTVITENVTVDIARPSSVNIAMSYTAEDGSKVEISAGDTVRIAPVTLSMAWDASTDASGIASYDAGWSTSATIDVNALTHYAANATRQHSYEAGEAEMLYAHLLIYDNNGNAHMQTVGPVYVDSPVTPDIIATTDEEQTTHAGMRTSTLRAATRGQQRAPENKQAPPPPPKPLEGYAGWQESGCAETGFQQQPPRNTRAHGAANKQFTQHFYTTWDDNGLQLTWQGANWDSDGDLYIYFDMQEGGSNIAFDPYQTSTLSPTLAQENTEHPDITLPFEADAMLWMSDTTHSALMLWDATNEEWVADTTFADENTWYEVAGRRTNFYIPFDVLAMDDPANTTLQMIALASEKDALRLWATMPQGNALNSHRVINPFVPEHLRNKGYSLDRAYTWEGVGAGICPSDASGQQTAIDVALHVITDPPHPFYSIMGDGLFGVKDEVLNGTDTGNIDVGFRGQVSPNVHPGQEINVKVQYVNRSPRPSPPIILRVKSLGALTLPDGQPMEGTPRPRMVQLLQVGELAPYAEGEATFNVYVDPDSTDKEPTVRLEIEIQTQRTLDGKRPPLDVYWAMMNIDREAPTNMRITSPLFPYLKPGELELTGVVSDASEIRSVALELGNMEKPTPPKLCGQEYITGMQWTCPITIPLNTKADQMLIRAKATDIHGLESEWTEWKTYIVDTVPPMTTLHSGSKMAVAGPDTKPMQFAVQDNHMPVGAEVCRTSAGISSGTVCTTYAATSTYTPTDELTATGELSPMVLVRVPFNVPNNADGVVEYWEVRGFDSVGNMHTSPITGVYMLDSVAPVIMVTQQLAGPVALSSYTTFSDTLTAEPVLSGTVADGGRVQRVVARIIRPATGDGQAQNFVTQPARYDAASGTWEYVPKLERTGEHTIIIRAYDVAGNMRETQQYTLSVRE